MVTLIASYFAVAKDGSYAIWIGAFLAGSSIAGRAYSRIRAIREAQQPADPQREKGDGE
jgi:hypothetical protein